jgi:hypothetical protein
VQCGLALAPTEKVPPESCCQIHVIEELHLRLRCNIVAFISIESQRLQNDFHVIPDIHQIVFLLVVLRCKGI